MSLERDKKKLKRQPLFDIQLKDQKVKGRKAQALSQQVSMTKIFIGIKAQHFGPS